MGSIPVGDSDFFFVPHSSHVDQFPFHIQVTEVANFLAEEIYNHWAAVLLIMTKTNTEGMLKYLLEP